MALKGDSGSPTRDVIERTTHGQYWQVHFLFPTFKWGVVAGWRPKI